jgi:DNA replication protein DnaC
MEARDERRLRALQKHLNTVKLLIVDELGYVPYTAVGSELLFEVFSQRYPRGPASRTLDTVERATEPLAKRAQDPSSTCPSTRLFIDSSTAMESDSE